VLFVLLAAVYSFSVGLRATNASSITGDEPFYLMTTVSLIDDGDFDLTNQYERRSFEAFFDHPNGLWMQSVETNGRIVSPHEPGLSVLVVPGYLLDGLHGVQVQLMLVAALTFSLAFVLTSLETHRVLLSWLVTAAVGLGATAFVYSTEIYPEMPGALTLVLGLLLVRRSSRTVFDALALAVLLTMFLWLSMKYMPLGALLGVAFVYSAGWRERIVFTALCAISGAFYVWGHYALFDDLTAYSVNTVFEGANTATVIEGHVSFQDRVYRIWGLLLDQRFGTARWAPLLLLLPASLPLLLRGGSTGRLVLGLIVAQVLVATFIAITMMGWWFPGRTLITVVPLTALPLALLTAKLPIAGKVLAGGLGLTSIAFTVALRDAVTKEGVRLAVAPFDMQWAPFRWSRELFPNYQSWGMDTVIVTVVWLTAFVASMAAVTWWQYRDELRSLRRRRPLPALFAMKQA